MTSLVTEEELAELAIPDYCFGNHLDDKEKLVIRVLEHQFKNSVFYIKAALQDQIYYDISLFVYEDAVLDNPSKDLIDLFENNVAIPIATELRNDAYSKIAKSKE